MGVHYDKHITEVYKWTTEILPGGVKEQAIMICFDQSQVRCPAPVSIATRHKLSMCASSNVCNNIHSVLWFKYTGSSWDRETWRTWRGCWYLAHYCVHSVFLLYQRKTMLSYAPAWNLKHAVFSVLRKLIIFTQKLNKLKPVIKSERRMEKQIENKNVRCEVFHKEKTQ